MRWVFVYRYLILVAVALLVLTPQFTARAADPPPLSELNLYDLMGIDVVSASNTAERLQDAPATVIVFTRDDIVNRGYSEMSEILDDLPGMEMIRPYGATWLKNYWRGYRNTIGEPFLLMVDGMVMNHLYFNTAEVISTLPLSSVERVEVVYGPASSVYGPNAFMGVINVITRKEIAEGDVDQRVMLSSGSFDTRIADANVFFTAGDFRVSVTGRIDNGDIDSSAGQNYEFTKNKYYSDRRLYGGFVDNPNLGGRYTSPHRNRALQLRVFFKSIEFGAGYHMLNSGYGAEYAADQAQAVAIWARPDVNLYLRSRNQLNDRVSSTTLVRFRESDVRNDSTFVESYTVSDAAGRPVRVADFSYWQALNESWSANQDFEVKYNDVLSFNAGMRFEQKDLQKAYDSIYGPAVPVDELDASSYPYPNPADATFQAPNRIVTEDLGGYLQAKYRHGEHHIFNVGLRHDDNSKYGGSTTVRAGWVGRYGNFVFKTLYGDAFQEPAPRLLYGGWTGSGSDPDLVPETTSTIEVSLGHTLANLTNHISVYDVRNSDTIVNTASGAKNLGDREVIGLDYHVQALVQTGFQYPLQIWGYYSHIFKADEAIINSAGQDIGTGEIGDLAEDKLWLGVTQVFNNHVDATLRGRYVGSRDTVVTNPVGTVDSYATVDATLNLRNLLAQGLGLTFKITNAFDEEYYHPGVRGANSGITPGFFDDNGRWHGSGGFYNSLLPQSGRAYLVTLRIGQ